MFRFYLTLYTEITIFFQSLILKTIRNLWYTHLNMHGPYSKDINLTWSIYDYRNI